MPTSSDPFDDDDDLFADLSALDKLEASALQASQAPKSRVIQPYHHTIAKPKATPSILSSTARFSGRKAPQPINTEPLAGNTGFGWEYGGKRSMEGNVQRHVENVKNRHENLSKDTNGLVPQSGGEEEIYQPDVVMGEQGYELGENEIVDSHTMRNIGAPPPASQAHQIEGAAARRAAIAQASQSFSNDASSIVGPSNTRDTSAGLEVLAPPQKFSAPTRSLSRSISAGHHPLPTTVAARAQIRFSPIPSEAEGSLLSSQGSLARKTAFQLDEEKKRSEALELEVAKLRTQLKARQNAEGTKNRERNDGGMNVNQEDNAVQEELQAKLDELQNQVWKAKGEAETIRRAQREVSTCATFTHLA